MRITRILLAVICTALFCSESFGEGGTNVWSGDIYYDGAISKAVDAEHGTTHAYHDFADLAEKEWKRAKTAKKERTGPPL